MNGDDVEEMLSFSDKTLYPNKKEREQVKSKRTLRLELQEAKDGFITAALELWDSQNDINGLYDHFEIQCQFKKTGHIYGIALEALRKSS